jgi:3-deoxy-manno-octulosonate cytidylyltransferase (CMP-KDO synthetase)
VKSNKVLKSNYNIVIPARMASQRLPGKPLLDIAGRPLIEHVYRRACCSSAQKTVIATDDQQILEVAREFGAHVVMTSKEHQSGSDRIAECADQLGWGDEQLIVNLQGDEPLMPASCLDQVAGLLDGDPAADVASLYWPLDSSEEITNPNVVKVVTGKNGQALYFSRSVVPFPGNWDNLEAALQSGINWQRHVGLYAYRAGALRAFTAMQATPLESTEKLEQLRFLESGRKIRMAQACQFIPAGVDTGHDLERVRKVIEEEL